MKIHNLNFFVALLLVCLAAPSARAQVVSGVITDEQNNVVANAEIFLFTQNKAVAKTASNVVGEFALDGVGEKNLLLRVNAIGFAVFEKKLEKSLNANFDQPLKIVLTPANLAASVTVSVTGAETRLAETPASIIVLNRQTLDNTAANTIDDALRQVPGFTLFRRASSRTANPTTQGANLRGVGGSGAARTAVLFDGTSLNDAFGGWTYWNRVPRAAIEQIEVLRGGASTVYGSGGLSGAINILSKNPSENSPVLRIESSGGTQNTLDGSLFAGLKVKDWSSDWAAETFQTSGYFPIPPEARGAVDARANSRHQNGFLKIGNQLSEHLRVFARGSIFAERRDNGTNLQKNRTYFRQATGGADFENQNFGSFQLRVLAETQIYDQNFTAIAADRNTENLTRIQRVPSSAISVNLFWTRSFNNHALSGSIEAKRVNGFSNETIFNNNITTSTIGAGGRQTLFGVFAQDFWRVNPKLNLNFGGRFDFWRDADALSTTRNLIGNQLPTVRVFPAKSEKSVSPQIAALYQITDNLAATVSFNRSFRAPNLNELYRAFRVGNVLTLANENLRAERATNFEGGLRYSFFANKFNLRTNVFSATVSRPVVSITQSAAPNLITRQRQNLGETRSNGLELDFETKVRPDLTLSAGYLIVNARVTDFPANVALVNNFLPQIPQQQLTFQALYRPAEYSIGLQSRISSKQFDDDQNQFQLNSFFTLDVFASRRLFKNLEVFAAAENVFNKRYDIALTPNLNIGAPRSVRIGFRFSLVRK